MIKYYIVVLFGEANFDKIENFFLNIPISNNNTIVFVQNKEGCNFPKVKDSFDIRGDNKLREFGGYNKAVNYIEREFIVKNDDILILMNDTIFKSFNLIAKVLNNGVANLYIMKNNKNLAIVPVVIEVGDINIFDTKMDRLFATFFMAMRYDLLKKIGGMLAEIHYEKYLSSEYSDKLFINPNTPEYNNFYNNWLGCGKPGGVGNWWASSAVPFNSNNFYFLRAKAQMILLETSFSVRLKQNNVEVFDLYRRSHFIQFLRISRQRIQRYLK